MCTFNLIADPWIPVLRLDGLSCRVGIWDALTQAGSIRQIAASNPMDNAALVRFLLAVLLWCKPNTTTDERGALVGQLGIPPNWLDNLGTKEAPHVAFNLLGDDARFYQERRTHHKWRPIGDLLVEFPTETKIAHFRHVRDGQYGFCPGCCALGIVRFCAFANRAGRGYTEGVNGPTPAYKLVAGGTLLKTLLANWPNTVQAVRNPPWCDPSPPTRQDLDALTVLAWRSRRIWLGTPEEGGVCAHCGQQGSIIRTLEFGGGWKPPKGSGKNQEQFWRDDPHLILVHRTSESEFEDQPAGAEAGEQTAQRTNRKRGGRATTLRFPVPGRPVMAHVGLWRRVLAALAIDGSPRGSVAVVGAAASQTGMLYQDAVGIRLPCLPGELAREALSAGDNAIRALKDILKRSTPNPRQQHTERQAALEALSPDLEAAIRRQFFLWLEELEKHSSADPNRALAGWQARLEEALMRVLEIVVRATVAGPPVRRIEALENARLQLRAALRRVFAKLKQAPAAETGPPGPAPNDAKPKRAGRAKTK